MWKKVFFPTGSVRYQLHVNLGLPQSLNKNNYIRRVAEPRSSRNATLRNLTLSNSRAVEQAHLDQQHYQNE